MSETASPCDTCPKPGKCCVGFDLDHPLLNETETPEEVDDILRRMAHDFDGNSLAVSLNPADAERPGWRVGFPFRPLYKRWGRRWRFWCPKLDIKTGRCSDYENRPALCRAFTPKSDRLCCLYVAPDSIPNTELEAKEDPIA